MIKRFPRTMVVALSLTVILAAGCKDEMDIPTGMLLAERPLSALADHGEFALADTVWLTGEGDSQILIWFQRDGDRLLPRLIDREGYMDPGTILSGKEYGEAWGRIDDAMKSARAEAERRGDSHPYDAADQVSQAHPDQARRIYSDRIAEAHRTSFLPAPIELLPTRDGAVVQTRYGRLVILSYLSGTPQSGRLSLYKEPSGLGMGTYFPDRPGGWTALRRTIASALPWASPPLPRYRRAPDPLMFMVADLDDLNDTDNDLDWPLRLSFRDGGRKAMRFLDHVGAGGWYAQTRIELRATTLPPPRSLRDTDALQAHLARVSGAELDHQASGR